MKSWGKAGWLMATAVAVCAAGLVVARRTRGPALPPLRSYGNLPGLFDKALRGARDQVRARPGDADAVRALARLYEANHLYPEARACYRVVAASGAGLSARDHYYLAAMAQDDDDLDAAERELRATVRADPNYLPARLVLADVLFKSGRADDAAAEYAAILARQPDHPQAAYGLARIELQRGDDDAAVARLEALLARHPESTAAPALLAQVMSRRGDAARAAALTEWSRQRSEPIPPDPWRAVLRADCYESQRLELEAEQYIDSGQMDQALPLLDRVEALNPRSWIPSMLRGWSAAQAGHELAAAREYRRALDLGGYPELICPQVINCLLALGDYAEATAFISAYRAKLPDSIPILTAAAEVAVRRGDTRTARSLLTQVLQREPYLYPQALQLVRILWAAGDSAAAVPYLQRIVGTRPLDVNAQALLAQYCLEHADPVAAIAHLEPVMAGSGAAAPALREMLLAAYLKAGDAAVGDGNAAGAVRRYDQAIRLAPDDPRAYAGKAGGCVQLRQFGLAADALARLAALQPGNPTVFLSLGDVLYQGGEQAGARRQWERARQLTTAADADLRRALDLRLSGRITAETFQ